MTLRNADFDVAIVGYGPIGQLLSGLLGAQGFRVGVFERWPEIYALPRACVVDHEVMRILQADGIADAFEKVAVNTQGEYLWTNAEGRVLLSLKRPSEGVSGWGSHYMMYQPDLEHLLEQKSGLLHTVTIERGWTATAVQQDAAGVSLEVERGEVVDGQWQSRGEQRRIRARFLVGADGANSFVREATGLGWIDLGFRADWIVIDFRPHDPDAPLDIPLTGQICDPARPVSLFRRLGRYHVRWEMMLLPGESAADITRTERIWQLLSRWVKPEDGVIVRRAVYTFKSGIAREWRRGRIAIAGDAAHLMPPFLGQGMCSGMRDAMSLCWRLAALLRGEVSDQVLESYAPERRRHVEGVIARSVALGKIVCITDPAAAAARDAQFLSGNMPALPEFPSLQEGLLQRENGRAVVPAGQLCVQATVRVGEVTGRFDDVVGRGWFVLSIVAGAEHVLSDRQRSYLECIGARCAWITQDTAAIVDVNGRYQEFFRALGVAALVVRPDFYIFGAAKSLDALSALIDELMRQMPLETRVATSV